MDMSYVLDTFFALFAMTLIIFMVPGFAMLEAGLVRTKNVTAVLMTNTMIYAVASMAFLLVVLPGLRQLGKRLHEQMGRFSLPDGFCGQNRKHHERRGE